MGRLATTKRRRIDSAARARANVEDVVGMPCFVAVAALQESSDLEHDGSQEGHSIFTQNLLHLSQPINDIERQRTLVLESNTECSTHSLVTPKLLRQLRTSFAETAP